MFFQKKNNIIKNLNNKTNKTNGTNESIDFWSMKEWINESMNERMNINDMKGIISGLTLYTP